MKDTKFFIISGLLVLLFGIGVFVFNIVDTEKIKNIDITTTQTDKITVYEPEEQEYIMDGNSCFRTAFIKTKETKDGVLVGEYQENIFKCFCEGEKKAIEWFEFKTTDSVAGPVCDKQCAKLCENKYKITHKCYEPSAIDINENGNHTEKYFSQCVCFISEHDLEPIGIDFHIKYESDSQKMAYDACDAECQTACENNFQTEIKNNPDFKITRRW